MQIRVHFCLTLYVRSRLDRIRLSTKLTGVKVEPATLSFNIDRQINIVALFLSVLVLERGFCVEKYCDDAGFAFGSTVMADNEQKAAQLMAEAEKKLNAGKSFFGSLFG